MEPASVLSAVPGRRFKIEVSIAAMRYRCNDRQFFLGATWLCLRQPIGPLAPTVFKKKETRKLDLWVAGEVLVILATLLTGQ